MIFQTTFHRSVAQYADDTIINRTINSPHDSVALQTDLNSIISWSKDNTMQASVVVETVSETSHLCWNNETIRFKSSLTSIIIESTYLTLNMNKIWGCFKVQVGWKKSFYGKTGSRKGLGETLTIKKHFLTFTLSVNKIIIYQFSMFKSLDSIASAVGIFMHLTISNFKQVPRSRKGLVYNTVCSLMQKNAKLWI